jgi:Fungal specific transcription factor domain
MNAVYLWACFVSRPEPLSQQEEFYLQRSLEAIPDALRVGQSLDVIRASCLLATYFLSNGRLLEGSYHASAAAALAEQIGLGKQADCLESEGKSHERILTFWQVYNVDKTWSVVLQKKALISDGPEAKSTIVCPWPEDDAEYKMVCKEV